MLKNTKQRIAALIVAGGSGKRMGLETPKQYLKLGTGTILEKTVKAFYNNGLADIVCIVISPQHEMYVQEIKNKFPDIVICHGGVLRQDSVTAGLDALTEFAPDYVLIHDAVRPFVSEAVIRNVIEGFGHADAVLPAVPVKDTIKFVDAENCKTLPREKLFSAQTPQGFKFDILKGLKRNDEILTDDIALAEKHGIKIKIVEGDYANYKITTMDDLNMGEQKYTRTGNGFDVHQFADGNGIILCGCKIPYIKKLKGHSDADCAWHALTDAILGAIGLGDIGEHFPDTDQKWKGADSVIFLEHAVNEIMKMNGEIINVDITIICEEPKMKIHKQAMKEKTAAVLKIPAGRVNVKATTTEKLGFLGRKEGLAVMATVSVLV